MPRRANFRRQIPSVLVQRRGLPVHRDLGVRHHAPDHFDRLIAAHRISDQDGTTLRHGRTAASHWVTTLAGLARDRSICTQLEVRERSWRVTRASARTS